MKFIKLLLIITSLITASNSYAGWSKELSVKGNGSFVEKSASYSQMHYFPSAGIYSGKLQVIVSWQQNLLGLTGGSGFCTSSLSFYSGGIEIGAESRNLAINKIDNAQITFTVSNVVDSFRPIMNVHIMGWRKGLSRVWLYY